jgi:hypothetical protein
LVQAAARGEGGRDRLCGELMGFVPLVIATLCYVWACVDLARNKNWPMALAFGAYAIANVGLIIAAYKPK